MKPGNMIPQIGRSASLPATGPARGRDFSEGGVG